MKKTLRLLSVFLLLAAFTNCQKDDVQQTEARHFGPDLSPVKYLYGADALKAKEKLRAAALTKKINTKGLNGEKSDGWDIDFNEVLMVKDSTGRYSYTYRVTHPDLAYNQFYNLVHTEDANNNATIMLLRYTMTTDFARGLRAGTMDVRDFTGSITFTPVLGGQLIKPGLTPAPNPQPEPPTPAPADPCNEEIIINYPGPGSSPMAPGSSSGGSSSGGSNGGNNGGLTPPDLSYTNCLQWFTIRCSENTEGHYGNNGAACTAKIKGATYLINRCTGATTQVKSGNTQLQAGPCTEFNGVGVLFPPPYNVLFSPSLLNNFPCHTKIIQDVNAVSTDLMDAFRQVFDDPNSVHNITYTNRTDIDANARTFPPEEIIQNAAGINIYNIEIGFREDFLNTATDLKIAATAIHENIHAILLYFRFNQSIYTMFDNPSYDQLLTAYINKRAELGNIPFIPNNGNLHHQFMAQFTSDVAATLKAYGISKGYNLPDQFYNDMSWAGLTEIQNPNGPGNIPNPIFIEVITSNTVRQRIVNRLKVEESRSPLNGMQPSGNSNSCNK